MKAKLSLVLIVLLAICMAFVSCDIIGLNNGVERLPVMFSGTSGDATYTLTISPPGSRAVLAGDHYVLTVVKGGVEKTSVGKVTVVNGDAFVLQPSVEGALPFNLATSSGNITSISNTITFDDETSESGPGPISPGDHIHQWGAWVVTTYPTSTTAGEETRTCALDPSHKETRAIPATDGNGTQGLAFALINNGTAYRVSKGTATSGAVVIPASYNGLPVTGIAETAFYRTYITSITIPSGVTSIGDGAFYYCPNLTSVTLPSSVTSIGDAAFGACESLASITVDADNPSYSSDGVILYNKSKTLLITVPGGTSGAVEIPEGVTSIGDAAFIYCPNLASVTVPPSVTSIGNRAFAYCERLEGIFIPESVSSIGDGAFYTCENLASITVDADNPSYSSDGGILYNKAKTRLITAPEGISGAVEIPGSVTAIGNRAFAYCLSLTSVTIPAGVTSIGANAFSEWRATQTINIGGHASQASADAAWGGWRNGCHAVIKYWNGSDYI